MIDKALDLIHEINDWEHIMDTTYKEYMERVTQFINNDKECRLLDQKYHIARYKIKVLKGKLKDEHGIF